MTDQGNKRGVNPYQPPRDIDQVPVAEDLRYTGVKLDLGDETPVPFSGSPEAADLKQFLQSYDTLAVVPLIVGVAFSLMLLLWAAMISAGFAIFISGVLLILLLAVISSTRWYRVAVFRSTHPSWCDPSEGELDTEGLRINSSVESAFYRWSWFSGVVIADGMVGFVPGDDSETPVLISSQMLPASVSLSRLKAFARSAKVVCENETSDPTVAWANKQVMCEPDRQRTTTPPAGSILFEGLTGALSSDSMSIAKPATIRPARAHLMRAMLTLGLVIISIGLHWMLWPTTDPVLSIALLFLTMTGLTILGFYLLQPGQSEITAPNRYLIAYADEDGITLDYFVAVISVPWTGWSVHADTSTTLLLEQKKSNKRLVVREDMFSSVEQWQTFVALVGARIASQS